MRTYSYTETAGRLSAQFSMDRDSILCREDGLIITNNVFHSHVLRKIPELLSEPDKLIRQNRDFKYIIFAPEGKKQYSKAVLMLHGLNERAWDKYLPWASYLSSTLERPVILFPIAFHMNRSAPEWLQKKTCFRHFLERIKICGPREQGSFANTYISERLENEPSRFFSSGLQTYMDIVDLVRRLRGREQGLFTPDTEFDIFGYSIGAFLGQILQMADPEGLFDKSRLFLFCGGSVLDRMDSGQRTILDSKAAQALLGLVRKILGKSDREKARWNSLAAMTGEKEVLYFKSMLDEQNYAEERNSRLWALRDRIKAVSLAQDLVVPARAVAAALGDAATETDFPYQYKHEDPFPVIGSNPELVDQAFLSVFNHAAEHLH